MEKPIRIKSKNKAAASKQKSAKKRKSDGPTCSMFLAELTKKLMLKKKQEAEAPINIVQTIIESLTNALPVRLSKRSPPRKDSPLKIETLQSYAPELLPNDTLNVPRPVIIAADEPPEIENPILKGGFKMPKMPVASSDVFKPSERRIKMPTEDVAVNTGGDHDVAGEIAKYVGTLRKISLIAEEFNQKTAKNLKEIVDSVQEDLIKKLEEIKAEQGTKSNNQLNVIIESECSSSKK
ncbi:uncharacterized protein LOC119831232 [Zerene cesonia]|uniref:uncharacterized protein LOC119831232 n=1 Tax=Zerene cesonia TaxID=33412 RepID=UPI0018E56E5B|nr:uncharacterized protein LOC119831232 [Zerene cesonia]